MVLLVVGVASPKHISYYDNEPEEKPMMSDSQERRICAELCMSGLGGEPCGSSCEAVIPQGLPRRSLTQSAADGAANITRKDACPLLCANRLGYPLCSCNATNVAYAPFFKVNYQQICTHFCLLYRYQIYGCDTCATYRKHEEAVALKLTTAEVVAAEEDVDWEKWCVYMCKQGDGGAACYCDLLPMKHLSP